MPVEGFVPKVRHPVCGLPAEDVQYVLESGVFALDGKYIAALNYLKWLAEGHFPHPLFKDFDTATREVLYNVSHEAARCYFGLLGDCIYDPETKWSNRR